MKFESLIMKDFMRYKGVNRLEFSTDAVKNVTVVLGDNTVGKTTIAQAFRWCLYGKLMRPKGKAEEDYVLLNQTVMEEMDANSRENVSVELVLSDDEKRYRVLRQATYQRKVPSTRLAELYKNLQLFMADRGLENWEEVGHQESDSRRQDMIGNIINELLPVKLSHYFLFDGEKWSDFEYSGNRENIKESVHILTGLSSMQAAMRHLKGLNANSVLGKFRHNITGSGAVYDEIQKEISGEQRKIEQLQEKRKVLEANIQTHQKESQKIEDYLIENRSTEALQKELGALQVALRSKRERARDAYKSFMQDYSNKAFMLAAEPMIQAMQSMMKNVELERRDIPFMKQDTIDFLIDRGKCICGTCIEKDGEPYRCLVDQREYLPPADIGSILGEFEKTAKRMTIKNGDNYEQLREEAKLVSNCSVDLENAENQLLNLEQRLENNINFKEYREQQKYHQQEIFKLDREGNLLKNDMESAKRTIQQKEQQLSAMALRNQENEKWRRRVELVQEVYGRLDKEFAAKENKVFTELNRRLQENFYKMFNARDKKIQLDKNYDIRMYYKTDIGYREETNLSEGEKVARNFAFIVTILDYNREQKAGGDKLSDTLPIVLDGPFSKLGDENIQLVSGCLPGIAEQVILFMLEKDWRYTGLDAYVGSRYHIDKAAEEAFARLRKIEE